MMSRTDSLEKTLMLGKIEGRKRRGQQRMRWLEGVTDVLGSFCVKWEERYGCRMVGESGTRPLLCVNCS